MSHFYSSNVFFLQKAKEKKEKLERLIEKYADKTLSGHVDSWHGGFGFIRGEGESRELVSIL